LFSQILAQGTGENVVMLGMAVWMKCGCARHGNVDKTYLCFYARHGNMDEMFGALYTAECAEELNK